MIDYLEETLEKTYPMSSFRNISLKEREEIIGFHQECFSTKMRNKLWKDLTISNLYVREKDGLIPAFELLNGVFRDEFTYSQLAEHLQERKDIMEELYQFKKRYEPLIKKNKISKADLLSFSSFLVSKNPHARTGIERLYEKHYDCVFHFKDAPGQNTSNFLYDFEPGELKYYRMLLCLWLGAETNEQIKNDINELLKRGYPCINEYADAYFCITKENDKAPADAFFAPILQSFKNQFSRDFNTDITIESIIVLLEFMDSKNIPINDKNLMEDYIKIYFLTKKKENKVFAKSFGKEFSRRVGESLKKYIADGTLQNFSQMEDLEVEDMNYLFCYLKPTYLFRTTRSITDELFDYVESHPTKEFYEKIAEYLSYDYLIYISDSNLSDKKEDYIKNQRDGVVALILLISESMTEKEIVKELDWTKEDSFGLALDFAMFVRRRIRAAACAKTEPFPEKAKEEEIVTKEEKEGQLLTRIRELEAEIKKFSGIEKELKNNDQVVRELKKKISDLNKAIDEKDKDRKELISLRNYMYETEQEQPDISTSSFSEEEAAEALNKDVKGIVIGGHENLHSKLMTKMPSWRYYPPGKICPTEVIFKADIVVMLTDHMDHATYADAMKKIRDSKTNLLYLHNVNVNYILQKIHKTVFP